MFQETLVAGTKEATGLSDQKIAVQRFALVISQDKDTRRYYFKVYDENRDLVFAPSDLVWEEAFRKFTEAGYFILVSETIGRSNGIALWEISVGTPPVKPKKRKEWPLYKTAAKQFTLVIDREEEPKHFYFKVYDESGAPIRITSAESYGHAREKLKNAGYLMLLDQVTNSTDTRIYWKIAR